MKDSIRHCVDFQDVANKLSSNLNHISPGQVEQLFKNKTPIEYFDNADKLAMTRTIIPVPSDSPTRDSLFKYQIKTEVHNEETAVTSNHRLNT